MRSHRPAFRLVVVAALLALVAAFAPQDATSNLVDGLADTRSQAQATIGAELADYLEVAPASDRIEVIVSFHDRAGLERFDALRAPHRPLQVLPMTGAYLTPGEIAEVASWPEVRGIHGNIELEHFNHQSVPLSGAPDVWALGYTGEGVTIAIHDTGIDGTHPDLSYPDKTIQNIKILHTRFVDFVHGQDNPTPTGTVEDQPHTDTTSGHGTHVASTAAGSGDHDPAYRGMAPDASVVGIGAGDVLFVYGALEGYDWLFVENGDGVPNHELYDIRIVNNSWGTVNNYELDVDNPIVQATYAAYEAGMTVVFSAGNSGPGTDTLNFYAQAPWVVGVGAFDKEGGIAGFSSRGYPNHPFKAPDVSGIGVSVEAANFTAWPVLPYASKSGTSMSAPHVSGLVALMLEANPDLSPDQVRDILRATTTPVEMEAWEAGTGLIDALAAVKASLTTEGELDAFLGGDTGWTLESAGAVVDPDSDGFALPYVPVEETWTGSVGPAVLWVGANDSHTFEVGEDTEFLNARITWDRSIETLDIVATDPEGREFSALTGILDYALGSSRILRVRNPVAGEWTLEVRGEVSVATPYAGRIVQYVTDGSNWPDAEDEEQTARIETVAFYKFTPYALGFASTYFMTGDGGFYVFSVRDSDGNVVDGAAIDLVMIDRTGEEVFRERAIQRGDGDYQVSDIHFDHTWDGEPGRTRVTFDVHEGLDEEVTLRDGAFFLNHLDVSAASVDDDGLPRREVEPGDEVLITGSLQRVNERVAALRFEPMTGADVTATLLDADGGVLDEIEVTTDPFDGTFTATLTVPDDATSLKGVVVEAQYDEPAFVVGPGYWYGMRDIALDLAGAATVASGVDLDVGPETVHGSQRTVEISALARHAEGTDAIAELTLTLRGSNGRTIEEWTLADFTEESDGVLILDTAYRLRGPAPWTFHLVMEDADGERHEATRTVRSERPE